MPSAAIPMPETCEEVGKVDRRYQQYNRDAGGQQADTYSRYDVRRRAGLRLTCDLYHRLLVVAGVVLRHDPDQHPAQQPTDNGDEDAPVLVHDAGVGEGTRHDEPHDREGRSQQYGRRPHCP
jgi:hypothetical protein